MVTPNVARILDLFDAALQALGAPPLVTEQLFTLDRELMGPDYRVYRLTHADARKLAVRFEVSDSGLAFYLDRTNEMPEWSFAQIAARPDVVQQTIRDVLSSRVLVQHQGKKTVLRLFSPAGAPVRAFAYSEAFFQLSYWHESRFRLYEPLLP